MDLGRLLAELVRDGGTVDIRLDGYHITVEADGPRLEPAAAPPESCEPYRPPVQGCALDILGVIKKAGRPLTRQQVVDALARAGRDHAEAKVKYTLTSMAELGVLVPDMPGYGVPKTQPVTE